MSIILDALKKSESDRLQKDTPGFSHVPSKSGDKGASPWIWIVLVLIGINIAVLAVIFMRPAAVPPVAASAAPRNEAPVPIPEPRVAMPAGTSTAQTANIIEPPTSTPQTPAPGAATQQPAPEPAVSVPVGPPVAAPRTNNAVRQQQPAGGTGEVTESYVTFGNLRAQGLLDVPDLHLDIHVYSLLSPDRFVFVNMRKYKEKETLEEGPVVSQITPDGVILTHRGLTFLLPRE